MINTESPNLTQGKKEKNQKFILDNLDKYVLDSRGNFFSSHFDKPKLSFISKEKVSNWKEIRNKMVQIILQNKEDWEPVLDYSGLYIKNLKDGRIFYENNFGIRENYLERLEEGFGFFQVGYEVLGELGYRKIAWKDYEENKKWIEEWRKREKEWNKKTKRPLNNNNNFRFTPPKSLNLQPTNNPPLLPADIQNQYNSDKDKDKEKAENNPNLTNLKEQQEVQELLKIVITAENLVEEGQSNPEILAELLAEKEKNTLAYQVINQEGQGEKLISQLEKNQNSQSKGNNISLESQERDKIIPIGIIFGSLFLAATVGLIIVSKKRNKWMKRKR